MEKTHTWFDASPFSPDTNQTPKLVYCINSFLNLLHETQSIGWWQLLLVREREVEMMNRKENKRWGPIIPAWEPSCHAIHSLEKKLNIWWAQDIASMHVYARTRKQRLRSYVHQKRCLGMNRPLPIHLHALLEQSNLRNISFFSGCHQDVLSNWTREWSLNRG